MLWPKKIHIRDLITKKNSCGSQIPHPRPHNYLRSESDLGNYTTRQNFCPTSRIVGSLRASSPFWG